MRLSCALLAAASAWLVATGDRRPWQRLAPAATVRPRRPWLALGVGAAAVAAVRLPLPLVVAGAVTAAGGWRWRGRQRAAAAVTASETAAVEVAYALAAQLRCGQRPAAALRAASETAGPLHAVLLQAADELDRGGALDRDLFTRAGTDRRRLRALGSAWAATAASGAPAALVLERLAETFDHDDRARAELDALLAGPRATTAVLALLPAAGLLLGQSIGAHPLRLLLHSPLGWSLGAAAAALDAVGLLWMRRIGSAAGAP